MGPMVTKQQYQRVEGYIRSGIDEGAELLAGGEGRPADLATGYFVKPTIFVGVKPEMRIAREEIFGPVLSVLTYETEEEAVRMANATSYPCLRQLGRFDASEANGGPDRRGACVHQRPV